jgi:hypothetical protein
MASVAEAVADAERKHCAEICVQKRTITESPELEIAETRRIAHGWEPLIAAKLLHVRADSLQQILDESRSSPASVPPGSRGET